MRTDEFLGRLDGVRATGDARWDARCPSHEDRKASLSVHENAEGWTILKCQVGCTVDDVVSAMRLTLADLFPERLAGERHEHRPPRPAPRPEPIVPSVTDDDVLKWKHRLYCHENLLAWLEQQKGWTREALTELEVGFDGERLTLPVRDADDVLRGLARYAPNGSPKMLTIKGTPRDLWPAPELYEPGEPILLVEGEPDAITACSLGVNAVALPGAATWDDAWPERFRYRNVVVMLDCDEPGRKAAARAVTALSAVTWVRSVDLALERSDGFDLGELVMSVRDRHLLSRRLQGLLEND